MKNKIKKKRLLAALTTMTVTASMIGALFPATEAKASDFWPSSVTVESQAAVVMELNTGTILYEKNPDTSYYPASITKIMTALVALENSNLDDVVTFSSDAVYKNEGDTSHIARDVNEQMTMEQCLYGMMLESANECAWAIGEHCANGDINKFIDMMNAKAKELGCTNTHFSNPNGLPAEDHYLSAKDMALIARAAYQNPDFKEIVGTKSYNIPPTNKHDEITPLNNHHAMLNYYQTNKYLYPYCTGGKTGYTTVANSTLVTYAEKDGMTLICVVLNAVSPAQYTDTRSLFDYCFDNFSVYSVAEYGEVFTSDASKDMGSLAENVDFIQVADNSVVVLPKTVNFQDAQSTVEPVNEGTDVVARLEYTYAGRSVGQADLIFTKDTYVTYPFDNVASEDGGSDVKSIHINFFKIIFILLGIAAIYGIVKFIQYKSSDILLFKHRKIDTLKREKPQYKVIGTVRRNKRRWRRRRRSRKTTYSDRF